MDSNNGTPAPFPMAGMGEMKRGKPPVNNGRVSPRTPGQAPPQKKPIGAPKKKVVKKALPKAPAGDPMEEFFAIMEQFVDEPEEMECPIQRASSVKEGHEMQSLVDALKAEIKAKDKLLEASEKEQQMLQEELKHAWNSTDELQRQFNDSEALVLKLQHENEVLRSAKRVLTTSPTDLSRRLAATESRNVELAEKMAACEKELEMTKIALQQAAQERDSLAEEMEAALASWAVDSPATPASGISSGTFSHSTSTSSNSSSQDEVQQLAMALDGVQRELRVVRGERDALMAAVRPSGRVNVNSPAGRSLRKSSSALSVPSSQQQQQAAQFNYKAIRQTVDSNPRVHFAEPIASRLPLASSAPC
ncbi:unnamed protein product [Closterium sp. Naga37s-1]|nr:unnamed protein product [Closterium sp. Naga37s-1]